MGFSRTPWSPFGSRRVVGHLTITLICSCVFDSHPYLQTIKQGVRIMGFDSYHGRSVSPAKVYHKWTGAGKLVHWNGKENVETPLPFKFAVLEQTRRIAGFAPMGAGSARYFSNEAVAYNDELIVKRAESGKPVVEVIRGKYSDIKEKLPKGARLSVCLYIYNFSTDQVEVINLVGSSLGEFIQFSKKNRIYENAIEMKCGKEKTMGGTVKFFPPEFTIGPAHSDEAMKVLVEADQLVVRYQQSVHRGEMSEGPEKIDQTPSAYEGEFSQEARIVQEPTEPSGEVDFGAIPF